jgi:hypothetical protein
MKQVGPFQLVKIARLANNVGASMTAGFAMDYASASGGAVQHVLAAFASNLTAAAYLDLFRDDLAAKGWQIVQEGDREDRQGQSVGRFSEFEAGGAQWFLWTNGTLFAAVGGAKGDPTAFAQAAPY